MKYQPLEVLFQTSGENQLKYMRFSFLHCLRQEHRIFCCFPHKEFFPAEHQVFCSKFQKNKQKVLKLPILLSQCKHRKVLLFPKYHLFVTAENQKEFQFLIRQIRQRRSPMKNLADFIIMKIKL